MATSSERAPAARCGPALGVLAMSLLAMAVLVGALLAFPELASAQPEPKGDANDAGDGIGDLIRGIAGPIVWSLGGLTGLAAYMRRDVGMAFTMLIITVIVGLFVTQPGADALQAFTDLLADALEKAG
jgi:hypothetical protein